MRETGGDSKPSSDTRQPSKNPQGIQKEAAKDEEAYESKDKAEPTMPAQQLEE